MRICDLIAKYIEGAGVRDVFMGVGGGMMFLTDGLACNEHIRKISCHHEQAVAMAATAYAKYNGFGCGFVTTGCGGTNAITGVLHAWQDNTPIMMISGQCKRKEIMRFKDVPLRQLGVQEADIVQIVKSITKYAQIVTNEEDILYHLEKAEYLAKSGRPGPVWLDIPLDISSMEINPDSLRHFNPEECASGKPVCTAEDVQSVVHALEDAKRPVIIAGHGLRLSGALTEFAAFVEAHEIPFVCSRLGLDVLPSEHPLYIGCCGNAGLRSANFAIQNADLVLSLGSRLSVSSTGQQYEYFAREAKVIAVDIDPYEHKKKTVHVESFIQADLKDFLAQLRLPFSVRYHEWAERCRAWKRDYPAFLPEYRDTSKGINLYLFMEELSKCLRPDDVLVTDAGSAVFVPPQGIRTTTREQRYITSGAQAEMGFTLPGCVGVSIARGEGKDVLGITGDGSLQMNIQEFQTIVHHHLPVKLFVWNNGGYASIRHSQQRRFGRLLGSDPSSGLSFPDLEKISSAYGIPFVRIQPDDDIHALITNVLSHSGPVVCEVMCTHESKIQPLVSTKTLENGVLASSPIEDMSPFLPREEFLKNMIVNPINEQK